MNGGNTKKHGFFFTGKLRKTAHFLAFSWEKFFPQGLFQGRRAPRGAHLLAAESAAKEVLPAHFILSFELMEVTT